jgi:two-component system, NarL family, nitrate/nitrite response regulator NarL
LTSTAAHATVMARTLLLGPSGTVRDLVGAVLSLQGFFVLTLDPETLAAPAADATQALSDPTVVVLVGPGAEEWDLARQLGRGVVLVAEGRLDDDEIVRAVVQGADAVVHTDASPGELARAVGSVRQGETMLTSAQARRLAAVARTGHVAAQAELRLTPRELAILQSVEIGESVKQTARSLGIAAKTVENLQSRLFRKLGARNRAHAVILAHRLGLLEPADQIAF